MERGILVVFEKILPCWLDQPVLPTHCRPEEGCRGGDWVGFQVDTEAGTEDEGRASDKDTLLNESFANSTKSKRQLKLQDNKLIYSCTKKKCQL